MCIVAALADVVMVVLVSATVNQQQLVNMALMRHSLMADEF